MNSTIRVESISIYLLGENTQFGAILRPFPSFTVDRSGAFVIAEVGINHSGSYEIAQDLIKKVSNAGADAVKFQYRNLDRTYSKTRNEIGDEILGEEINRNYLDCMKIAKLVEYAHSLDIFCGISFFTHEDINDFGSGIEIFDFFKVPSPELTNLKLIKELMNLRKFVFISTGAHSEYEITQTFESLPRTGWMPMHCVSNYPTHLENAKLGYLTYIQNKWNMKVGFSSHDSEWALIVGALALGACAIERHITADKSAVGLDHSSSSDLIEFSRICAIAKSTRKIFSGNSERVANQGELINLQNLGRSYFAKRDLVFGEELKLEDFEYRSPRIGLGYLDFQKFMGKSLQRSVNAGEALSIIHFDQPTFLSREVSNFARKLKISIPVRVHDYQKIREEIASGFYEFHLSYTEVRELETLLFVNPEDTISIHLPDYVSPNLLFDPFSMKAEQRELSLKLLAKVKKLVLEYQDVTGDQIIIVASCSNVWENRDRFYEQHSELSRNMKSVGITMCFQWLPPRAWYFGGTIELTVFNQNEDAKEVLKRELPICMDTSHLLLGANYFNFDSKRLIELVSRNIIHAHISEAYGNDGEGMQFGTGEDSSTRLILDICDLNIIKVIEVWQGHVNNFAGFKVALLRLKELYESR